MASKARKRVNAACRAGVNAGAGISGISGSRRSGLPVVLGHGLARQPVPVVTRRPPSRRLPASVMAVLGGLGFRPPPRPEPVQIDMAKIVMSDDPAGEFHRQLGERVEPIEGVSEPKGGQ